MNHRYIWVSTFVALLVCACVHRPLDELVLADVAVKAAQKARADALSPDEFRKAENYYLRAKKDYSEGYFDSCRKYADEARRTAEQAEYLAIRKQSQVKSGYEDGYEGRPQAPNGSEYGP